MKIFRNLLEWKQQRTLDLKAGRSLGFVPTMGALHLGHLSLVNASQAQNQTTLVSLFVNPTQFNNPTDLAKYPRTEAEDLDLLSKARADYVLIPNPSEIYADGYKFRVSEVELSRVLEGQYRPGHFDGVMTVVLKLLNLAQAEKAYFGEKDFQQYLLIKEMAQAFFIPTQIVGCPTVREEDGLAMSSRNVRLSPEDRKKAVELVKALRKSPSSQEARKVLENQGFQVDYVEENWGRRLGAASLGEVRLIDNVELT